LSHANAKGKGIDFEGWVGNQVFRLAEEEKKKRRKEEVRSPEEISKKLLGNLKIDIPWCGTRQFGSKTLNILICYP
jgi:hypothetical protein